jgi:hypothetical protein
VKEAELESGKKSIPSAHNGTGTTLSNALRILTSQRLPCGPQRGCEIIDIGDSSRAHYLIEEGSVEGDASI